MTKQIMTATIERKSKAAFRVFYQVASEDLTGAGWTYGIPIEIAKENFEKSSRAKKYRVEWRT